MSVQPEAVQGVYRNLAHGQGASYQTDNLIMNDVLDEGDCFSGRILRLPGDVHHLVSQSVINP